MHKTLSRGRVADEAGSVDSGRGKRNLISRLARSRTGPAHAAKSDHTPRPQIG